MRPRFHIILTTALLTAFAALSAFAQEGSPTAPYRPLIFPVVGKVYWMDTFGADRDGGQRKHQGQDLMAPKMRKLVAAFDGVISLGKSQGVGGHNTLSLQGDNGLIANYYHINNDTPGTDDGLGTELYAFAPGLNSGDRVFAGQFIAFCGDSGNAENTAPHLHFELWRDGQCLNPAAALKQARHLREPLAYPATPHNGNGEVPLATIPPPDAASNGGRLPGWPTGNKPGEKLRVERLPQNQVQIFSPRSDKSVSAPQLSGSMPANFRELGMSAEEYLARKIVELTNRERSSNGLPPLKIQESLTAAAREHAEDMARKNYFDHTDRDGGSPSDRAKRNGYGAGAGENIFLGPQTSESAVDGWMKSPGHHANMLNTRYTEIGVGYATGGKSGRTPYWVQNFGDREDVYPVVINGEEIQTGSIRVHLYIYGRGRARQMRFSNDGHKFSNWEPFRSERDWFLEPGRGMRTVTVQLGDGRGNYRQSSDTILLLPQIIHPD